MGCIRVDKITEYLCDPLQRCLKDDDPYVRKTAAVCVAKLYDINAELVEDRGFLDALTVRIMSEHVSQAVSTCVGRHYMHKLPVLNSSCYYRSQDMLSDSNPMVVANAVASLAEIQEVSGKDVFQVTSNTLFKLLAALNECTEWGQVFILDSLVNYTVIIKQMEYESMQGASRKVFGVNVLSTPAEAVNLSVFAAHSEPRHHPHVVKEDGAPSGDPTQCRTRDSILAHEVKVFFCKYNDPVYVKLEKLEIMIKLANERNIDQAGPSQSDWLSLCCPMQPVLLEFKEYATEVDVDFVRKAVRAIGRCAVSLERAAERCINVLLELIQTKVNYVVQEAIIVIKSDAAGGVLIYAGTLARISSVDIPTNTSPSLGPSVRTSTLWMSQRPRLP
eukprot:scaffold140527_cov46-Prasinocladus_malaysianus.AAC.1